MKNRRLQVSSVPSSGLHRSCPTVPNTRSSLYHSACSETCLSHHQYWSGLASDFSKAQIPQVPPKHKGLVTTRRRLCTFLTISELLFHLIFFTRWAVWQILRFPKLLHKSYWNITKFGVLTDKKTNVLQCLLFAL